MKLVRLRGWRGDLGRRVDLSISCLPPVTIIRYRTFSPAQLSYIDAQIMPQKHAVQNAHILAPSGFAPSKEPSLTKPYQALPSNQVHSSIAAGVPFKQAKMEASTWLTCLIASLNLGSRLSSRGVRKMVGQQYQEKKVWSFKPWNV